FLNPIGDVSSTTDLVNFFHNNGSFIFQEKYYFQPQCLLCENTNEKFCFGYKNGARYDLVSSVHLITNLPYIYALGDNVGSKDTTVDAIAILRSNLVISYQTLARFKGIKTLDPIVSPKTIALRLCMICLFDDTNEYSLTVTGSVYNLNIQLFINEIAVSATNGFKLDGNKRARINCQSRTAIIENNGNLPDESPCTTGSCLGPEFCLTYQPEYSTTRETWCPLNENNWISKPENSLILSPSDSSLPLHIQIERVLLHERPFTLILNPSWFIDYPGVLTLSVPNVTSDFYSDTIWKIVLPSTNQRPLNRRIILLYNCINVRIQYNISDSNYFEETILFVDMKTNSTFTIKDNLNEAKQICNSDILVPIDNNPTTQTTVSSTLALSLTNGATQEPSIAHTVFLPREFDPFCDNYLETVTHMNTNELMSLPKLNDAEFIDQLARGIDTLPATHRAIPNNLFDTSIDEQMQYRGEIETEWEDLMAGGPPSVNYIGAVMAIASKKDFPLKSDFDYKFVKYPNSFQTTLVQVSNDMYTALSTAHKSMDKIQANMRQMPTNLKTALKLITQATTAMTKAMLPRTLATIGRYANESVNVARASLEKFEYLQELLQEIVLASTATNTDNREKAAEIAALNEEMKSNKTALDDTVNELKAAYEQSRRDLEKARQDYHTAMLNVPGGQWDTHAWNVYASHRPAVTCNGFWFFRKCTSHREQQFAQFSVEAKQKAQDALDILKKAEEHTKKLFDQQMNKQDEITVAMNQLATMDFNQMSIDETIKVLLNAAEKIALVQEQWSRITRFFSSLAIKTEDTQNVILDNFLGVIADAEKINQGLNLMDQTLYVMMLVQAATEIDQDSHLLFLTAKTYTDISNEYMVDQIAGISGLLALQTDSQRDIYVKQMVQKAETTAQKVKDLAADRQRKYHLASFDRQEQYMEFMQLGMIEEQIDILGGVGIGKR
ncbi:unnamed protein product, partial [Adineta steineri]